MIKPWSSSCLRQRYAETATMLFVFFGCDTFTWELPFLLSFDCMGQQTPTESISVILLLKISLCMKWGFSSLFDLSCSVCVCCVCGVCACVMCMFLYRCACVCACACECQSTILNTIAWKPSSSSWWQELFLTQSLSIRLDWLARENQQSIAFHLPVSGNNAHATVPGFWCQFGGYN